MLAMLSGIGVLSHSVAAVAFAGLAAALWFSPNRRDRLVQLTVVAALISALWAALATVSGLRLGISPNLVGEAESLRTAAWLVLLLFIVHRPLGFDRNPRSTFILALGLGFLVALELVIGMGLGMPGVPGTLGVLFLAARIVIAISGLVLLHNIYISAGQAEGPMLRFLAVGVGLIFAYDLNLYTLQFLTGRPAQALVDSRGLANALAVPLIWLALRDARSSRLRLSREAAFNTLSVSAIGLYLIVMSLLAYLLRLAGGNWGVVLQIVFLTATVAGAVLLALSSGLRARFRLWVARNFFRYRYDYRREWLRFIDKLGEEAPGRRAQPIPERLIEATAAVLQSPGGMLLEPAADGHFVQTARWQWGTFDGPPPGEALARDGPLARWLIPAPRILDFDALRAGQLAGEEGVLPCPAWAAADLSVWLGVPLIRKGELLALLLLQRSPVVRDLNWEDQELLRTLGQQGASYLAEAASQRALEEARSFDEYNRRFAFVMHDLKNVVSQLDLVARNGRRHIDNPEFRADLMATVEASVTKMKDLLALIAREGGGRRATGPAGEASVDLAAIVMRVATMLRRQHPALDVEGGETALLVAGDAGRLEAMLTHLVQNAIDASAPEAPVGIRLDRRKGEARIAISDHGHGMSAAFIRDELFKPFRSSKSGGFGIGAFEAREIAQAHGGRIDVASRPGEGSCFTVVLPLAAQPKKALSRA